MIVTQPYQQQDTIEYYCFQKKKKEYEHAYVCKSIVV